MKCVRCEERRGLLGFDGKCYQCYDETTVLVKCQSVGA